MSNPARPDDLPWERGWNPKGKLGDNPKQVLSNLEDFKSIMDEAMIPFTFIFGTLLGAIRNNDFIPYDDDIDLAVDWKWRYSQKWTFVVMRMEELGFYVARENTPEHDQVFIRGGEKLEIWFFERRSAEGKEDIVIYDPERCNQVWYPAWQFELKYPVLFHGKYYLIPADYDKFLRATYGNDYMTPIEGGCKNTQRLRACDKDYLK